MNSHATTLDGTKLLELAAGLRPLARDLVRDAHTADDLVQETLARSLENPPPRGGEMLPWMRRVARNLAVETRRKSANRTARERAVARHEAQALEDDSAEKLEALELLAQALGRLAEPYRSTITRAYLDGQSSAQIARIDRVDAGTVRWRLHEGMKLLRRDLDGRFDGDRRAWCAALLPLAEPKKAAGALVAWLLVPLHAYLAWSPAAQALAVAALFALLAGGVWGVSEISTERGAPVADASVPPSDERGVVLADARADGASTRRPVTVDGDTAAGTIHSIRTILTGRCVDSWGRPIEGVRVTVGRSNQGQPDPIWGVSPTAADGRFAVEVTTPGPAAVVCEKDGYTGRSSAFLVRGGEQDLGVIELVPAGRIQGVVVDEQGLPVPHAEVAWRKEFQPPDHEIGPGEMWIQTLMTDAHGTFVVKSVPLGEYQLAAGGQGSATNSELAQWTYESVMVSPSQPSAIVRLQVARPDPSSCICGRVVLPESNGSGVEWAFPEVDLVRRACDIECCCPEGSPQPVITPSFAPDGSFCAIVAADHEYDIQVVSRDNGEQPRTLSALVARVRGGTTGLSIALRAPREVSIQAVDADGHPVPSFSVEDRGLPGSNLMLLNYSESENGIARIPVMHELATARVYARGFRTETVSLSPADFERPVVVPMERIVLIRGRVQRDGAPVEQARVEVLDVTPGTATLTDSGGHFSLEWDPKGTTLPTRLVVAAGAPWERRQAAIDVVPFNVDPEPLLLELPRMEDVPGPGEIRARVIRRGGTPLRFGRVEMLDEQRGWIKSVPDPLTGIELLSGVAPGLRTCRLSADGLVFGREENGEVRLYEVDVRSGETTHLQIVLEENLPCYAAATVEIDGQALEEARGQVVHAAKRNVGGVALDAEVDSRGRMPLRAPFPGDWWLRLVADPAVANRQWINVPVRVDEEHREVRIALYTGGVSGQIESAPHVHVRILTRSASGAEGTAIVAPDEDGRFEVSGVLAGEGTAQRVLLGEGPPTELGEPLRVTVVPGQMIEVLDLR